jgi:hypothetical protein
MGMPGLIPLELGVHHRESPPLVAWWSLFRCLVVASYLLSTYRVVVTQTQLFFNLNGFLKCTDISDALRIE